MKVEIDQLKKQAGEYTKESKEANVAAYQFNQTNRAEELDYYKVGSTNKNDLDLKLHKVSRGSILALLRKIVKL